MLRIEESEADISDVIGISEPETVQLGVWKMSSLALSPLVVNLIPQARSSTLSHRNGLLVSNVHIVMNNKLGFI
jgi:hypothetical protein